MTDMIKSVMFQYPQKTTFVIVSKKQCNDEIDYATLSRNLPNVMIIICGKVPCVKSKQSKRGRKMRPMDMLAEADDHMLGLITRAITITGCAPDVLSYDKYRNSKDVMDNIPSYTYYTYNGGRRGEHKMESSEQWLKKAIPKLIGKITRCTTMSKQPCSACRKNTYPSCDVCGVCMYCRIRFVLKGPKLCQQKKRSK